MKKKIILGLMLTIAFLALLGIAACDPLGGGKREIRQQLVKVERGDLAVTVTGSGKIEASHETRLTFGSTGKVDQILVKEGNEVKKGDVLAELELQRAGMA